MLSQPALIPIFFVVFLFSLSFHEAAHAWTANKFGDPTGRDLGRVTLNPLPHIDIFGTIIFPIICMIVPGMLMFGWAKPVPVNTRNMTDPRWGDIWVSAAGPLSNAFLVVVFFMLYRFLFVTPVIDPMTYGDLAQPLYRFCEFGLMLNVDMHALGWLTLTLAAGTPALTFIGLIGAALSVALRRGGLLLAVLVLPLTVPVLIFGVASTNAAIAGSTPFGPAFTILCALSLASLVLGPIAATAALRHGLE